MVFFIGAIICAGAGYYFLIRPNTLAYTKLTAELATSRAEVERLGTLVIRSDDIVRRETEIAERERAIIDREAENNRRTKRIYSELRDIINYSYGDLDSLESIAKLVQKLEQMVNH